MYPTIKLSIAGEWRDAVSGESDPVLNPANGEVIGRVPHASIVDLEQAVEAADKGFAQWRRVSVFERYKIMRHAAELVRERAEDIARIMTLEQGKPLAEARAETLAGADIIDWFAEEARRVYGRIIPSRNPDVQQFVHREPVGPVAAFTPWNFPINQAVRKLSGALANGCSVILKGPEETPGSCAELVRAFMDAGVTPGAINLVFGTPSEISEYLIPHPVIRKITFTGSTQVGKQLAALAGAHMKRITMELGGHSPVVVFEDADLDSALKVLAASKYRNAGQVCVCPSRFIVHESLYDGFVSGFADFANNLVVGDGTNADTQMGPLANERRLASITEMVGEARDQGAKVVSGGEPASGPGYYYPPTVLADVPVSSMLMNQEPFGPVASIIPFGDFDEAVRESNRLSYGLAAYVYTGSARTANAISSAIESGMVSINHYGLALPEVPFGGVKDSGYGSEGGQEAMDPYLVTKFVTQTGFQA